MSSFAIKIAIFLVLVLGLLEIFFIFRNPDNSTYLSPLPDYLTLGKNNQVTMLDLWFPFFDKPEVQGVDTLATTAKSALTYDLITEKVLFEKTRGKSCQWRLLPKL